MSTEIISEAPSPEVVVSQTLPYVAVGPNSQLSVTFYRDTFGKLFVLLIVIGGILLFVIIILIIVYANNQTKFKGIAEFPIPPTVATEVSLLHQNVGALPQGRSLMTNCEAPFYGSNCEQETFDPRYFGAGNPDVTVLRVRSGKLSSEQPLETNSIHISLASEFPASTKNNCLAECDRLNGTAVLWRRKVNESQGMCSIIQGPITIGTDATIPFAPNIDASLYVLRPTDLVFHDRVFLARLNTTMPNRYWLASDSEHFASVHKGKVTKLKFFPRTILNHNPLTGIYSRYPFDPIDATHLLKKGHSHNCYIHSPGTELIIPIPWQYKLPLYVTYL